MDLNAYFARIGFNGARTPTLETLRALHLAHAQSIAFENLNPLLGWAVPIDVPSLEQKLVHSGRGGYCFEQNGLFAAALRELGFDVTGLAARVIWNAPEDAIRPRGHMLLKVVIDGEPYIADVGFGGQTLTGPLRLATDEEQSTPHELFRLVALETEGSARELKLQSFVNRQWKSLYRFDLQPQHDVDYEVSNYYLSTNPASHFRGLLMLARPVPDGRYGMVNNRLTRHYLDRPSETQILTSVAQVREALEGVFGLTLPPAAAELDAGLVRACGFSA
jgi:N-hydroxyarylamine O-acetyltransferase